MYKEKNSLLFRRYALKTVKHKLPDHISQNLI